MNVLLKGSCPRNRNGLCCHLNAAFSLLVIKNMQIDQYYISADGEPEDRNKLWVETNSWNSCFFQITCINWGRLLCNEKISPCPPTLYAFIIVLYAAFPSFTWEEPHLTAMFLWSCSFIVSFPTHLYVYCCSLCCSYFSLCYSNICR